jgi:hypothetical protein
MVFRTVQTDTLHIAFEERGEPAAQAGCPLAWLSRRPKGLGRSRRIAG